MATVCGTRYCQGPAGFRAVVAAMVVAAVALSALARLRLSDSVAAGNPRAPAGSSSAAAVRHVPWLSRQADGWRQQQLKPQPQQYVGDEEQATVAVSRSAAAAAAAPLGQERQDLPLSAQLSPGPGGAAILQVATSRRPYEAGWDPDVSRPVTYDFRYTADLPETYRSFPAAQLRLRPLVVATASLAARPDAIGITLQVTGDVAVLQPAHAMLACTQMMKAHPEYCSSERPAEIIVWATGPSVVRGTIGLRPPSSNDVGPDKRDGQGQGETDVSPGGLVAQLQLYDPGVYTVHAAWYFAGHTAKGAYPTLTVPLAGSPFFLDVLPHGDGDDMRPANSNPCQAGHDGCHWCTVDGARCEMCRGGLFLHDGTCIAACPGHLEEGGGALSRYSRYCRPPAADDSGGNIVAGPVCTSAASAHGRWVRCQDVRWPRPGGDLDGGCLFGGWVWLPTDCHYLVGRGNRRLKLL